jgi:hypothetical protein
MALSPLERLVRVLGSAFEPTLSQLPCLGADLLKNRPVGAELVHDEPLGSAVPLHQLLDKPERRRLVSALMM